MLQGLAEMPGGLEVLPFVRMFHRSPSRFLWEDVNYIPQGEGGEQGDPLTPLLFRLGQHSEQGDPLTPLLFRLGQHRALVSVAGELRRGEHLFAFHDDLYVTAQPDRVVDIHQKLAVHLWNDAKITLHKGKTVIWNRGGVHARGCHVVEVAARFAQTQPQSCGEGTQIWSHTANDIKVLGVPVSRPEFTPAILQAKTQEHGILLDPDHGHGRLAISTVHLALLCCSPRQLLVADSATRPQWRVCQGTRCKSVALHVSAPPRGSSRGCRFSQGSSVTPFGGGLVGVAVC